MNIYPINVARVEANVLSGRYDLSNDANNYAAQGFPTLDYLLYGIGSTDEEILSKYTADNTYLNYLEAVSDEMTTNTEKVDNDWETYKNEYTISTDNTATSAVNLMVNDFIFYTNILAYKIKKNTRVFYSYVYFSVKSCIII